MLDLLPLTAADHELIELARRTVDANTDGPDGVYTMGAAVRAADGRMFAGINLYHFLGGPCGRDRQILVDYHPDIRVILPTENGLGSVVATDLLPGAYRWTPTAES